ncbi:hypothetical protein [Acinetobacter baumannii]
MEEHQQPPIIATQHPPSRLPKSYIGAIRHYRRTSQAFERLVTVL